jgi:hypothetical protein
MVNGKVAAWAAEVVAEDVAAVWEVAADVEAGAVVEEAWAAAVPKAAAASYPNQPIFGKSFTSIKIKD